MKAAILVFMLTLTPLLMALIVAEFPQVGPQLGHFS